jgi:oligoribonuclease
VHSQYSPAVTSPLVWIDMEMTGLEPDECTILEMASVVTTSELEVIAQGPHLVIHHDDAVLDGMSDWCKQHHGASGLTAASRAATISLADAEQLTLSFLHEHTSAGISPLCGNSVDLDHRFIQRHMPGLAAFLQDRVIDVTALKELSRRWFPQQKPPQKKDTHRALEDILESIAELKFYKTTLFKKAEPT